MKNITFLVLGTVFTITGISIIGYLFLFEKEDEVNNYIPVSSQTSYPANNSANTRQTASTLQVQGATDSNQNQQQNQLPTPASFNVYEQYASSETTQYIDIVVGLGEVASPGDTVAMLYQGWLTNGQLFDQSKINEQNRIEAFEFQLGNGQVIQGWEQGIVGMKEGGKRRLIIPSTLGYGPNGQGPIPANAMLIFDVELVSVSQP
jgi:FKBP-type peptidyl-prolyl cis-trans isomerase FkpA